MIMTNEIHLYIHLFILLLSKFYQFYIKFINFQFIITIFINKYTVSYHFIFQIKLNHLTFNSSQNKYKNKVKLTFFIYHLQCI